MAVGNTLKRDVEHRFTRLCTEVGRHGVIGFAPVEGVRLLPEQSRRLQEKLTPFALGSGPGAISFGLFYHEPEILAIPSAWQSKQTGGDSWNDYARAYQELNRALDHVSSSLAAEFGGVAERATLEGWTGKVQHVGDYFAHCISHRAFAETAGIGWRGRHGLIVTPEAGPALRFATVFIPVHIPPEPKKLPGCGECRACLDICPILRGAGDYRQACLRRIGALGLEADVCGICVRACWEQVCRRAP
jgi:epoxyqueuosine reductase QueG